MVKPVRYCKTSYNLNHKKNMKSKLVIGFASLMMLVMLAGCAKAPQEQIDAARNAIESARLAEADVYVPAEFTALQNEMTAVMANIEAESAKTFRNFRDAKLQLENIVTSAATVQQNAGIAKEQVGIEVQALLAEINNLIVENKDLMTKAPRGKEGAAVLEQFRNEMTVIEAAVAEATIMHQEGKFMAARDKITAAMANAQAINLELKDAIAKVKRR